MRSFPARIGAGRKAELAFRVAGKVTQPSVKEGDEVLDGDNTASTQQCLGGAIIDIDSDGVFDDADALPNDPTETVDSDDYL